LQFAYEDWQTGRKYMIIEEKENQKNDRLLTKIKELKNEKDLVAL